MNSFTNKSHDFDFVQIQIVRPANYSRMLLIGLIAVMFSVLLYVKRNSFEFLYNYIFWGIFVLVSIIISKSFEMIFHYLNSNKINRRKKNRTTGEKYLSVYFQLCIFFCISGQIWNNLRGSSFVHRDPKTGQIVSVLFILGFCLLFHLWTNMEFHKWSTFYAITKRWNGKIITRVYGNKINQYLLILFSAYIRR